MLIIIFLNVLIVLLPKKKCANSSLEHLIGWLQKLFRKVAMMERYFIPK